MVRKNKERNCVMEFSLNNEEEYSKALMEVLKGREGEVGAKREEGSRYGNLLNALRTEYAIRKAETWAKQSPENESKVNALAKCIIDYTFHLVEENGCFETNACVEGRSPRDIAWEALETRDGLSPIEERCLLIAANERAKKELKVLREAFRRKQKEARKKEIEEELERLKSESENLSED